MSDPSSRRAAGLTEAIRAANLWTNLDALSLRFPPLAAAISGAQPTQLETSAIAGGDWGARIPGGPWLHSRFSPRMEARRLAQAGIEPDADAVVLLGFGLGYLAEACLDAGMERVIVCEADPGILNTALGLRDVSKALGDGRLGFVVGGDPGLLLPALELSGAKKASLIGLRGAELGDPDWYDLAREAHARWSSKNEVNRRTLGRFGRLWVRNLASNLEIAADSGGVGELSGLFAGLPAVVLAAGPSLDEVLPRLDEIAQRAVIICVDTALRSVLRTGIEPDFLVVVDPQYWNWRHIAGQISRSSILVSESAVWPAVLRFPARATYLGGSLFPLGRRIESFTGDKGELGAGGSVATSAWDLARIMGCEPIWMAGLDLGFPGGRTHAAASLFEQRSLAAGIRLASAETLQAAALVGGDCLEEPARGGGTVRTDRRMALYAWWFEARLARRGMPRSYAIGERGLEIPGMPEATLGQLLDLPSRRREIEISIDKAGSFVPPPGRREAASQGLASLLEELGSIRRCAARAREAARNAVASLEKGAAVSDGCVARALAVLEEADAAILGNEARELVGFLLPPLSELLGPKPEDLRASLEQSALLYEKLAQSAEYHLRVLGKASLSTL